jgi:hypothetical protein
MVVLYRRNRVRQAALQKELATVELPKSGTPKRHAS